MSNDSKKDTGSTTPEWHPYKVWQQRIRDAEAVDADQKTSVTGSWRTDTVWQNLIKG
ncbi:MAG: hypothetical protein HKN49_14355 [Gammaproteobacteria bacterium]|nr:hypothetical protein [Gammaproteobacteria bacterium]